MQIKINYELRDNWDKLKKLLKKTVFRRFLIIHKNFARKLKWWSLSMDYHLNIALILQNDQSHVYKFMYVSVI